MKKKIQKTINIPEEVQVQIDDRKITVSGPVGKNARAFIFDKINIKKENSNIVLWCDKATKREKKRMNSIASHIRNMVNGVCKEYTYKLQICSIHFPMNVKIQSEKKEIIIKNFLGERKDRIIKIIDGVKVNVDNDIIIITSSNKEAAGQQAANIEKATKIRHHDRRIFQDGIWIIKKEKGAK